MHRSEAAKSTGAFQLTTCGTKGWIVPILLSTSRFFLLKGNSCPKQEGFRPAGPQSWSVVEERQIGVSPAPVGVWFWDRQGFHRRGAASLCGSQLLQAGALFVPGPPAAFCSMAGAVPPRAGQEERWLPGTLSAGPHKTRGSQGSCRAPAALPSNFPSKAGGNVVQNKWRLPCSSVLKAT